MHSIDQRLKTFIILNKISTHQKNQFLQKHEAAQLLSLISFNNDIMQMNLPTLL